MWGQGVRHKMATVELWMSVLLDLIRIFSQMLRCFSLALEMFLCATVEYRNTLHVHTGTARESKKVKFGENIQTYLPPIVYNI